VSVRWVIAGGGTGGHVTPALALAEEIRRAGEAVLLVGTRRGLETRLVPEAGFELVALDSRPVVGRRALERLAALAALARATREAARRLRAFRADLVVAVGGYASVPAALAALLQRRPLALVNTDARPGRANRLLARFAARIFTGFEPAAAVLRRRADDPRVVVSGVPLREALRRAFEAAPRPTADARLHLFVFGGSQGARQLNDLLVGALPHWKPADLAIVHQTGDADRERVARAYQAAGFDAEVLAFERDMPSRYRWADLVVCRAGAITVAELTLAGRPALLVPLAHVGGGEQFANARLLEDAGAARVLDPRGLGARDLADAVSQLGAERGQLAEMGGRAASLARPDAAAHIVSECRALVRARRPGEEET
jgi:UDP-N-acetylglucosamine--N-acetylmuramyl-(pentapeptide) pyrophosphoryl-undecaprenol N-acetylglucosamine transferase